MQKGGREDGDLLRYSWTYTWREDNPKIACSKN